MLFSVSDGAGLEGVVFVVDVDGPLLSPQATTADDIAARMSRHAALRRRWVEFTFACLPPFASVGYRANAWPEVQNRSSPRCERQYVAMPRQWPEVLLVGPVTGPSRSSPE